MKTINVLNALVFLKLATAQLDLSCTSFERSTVATQADSEDVCKFNKCLWLAALEQNGTETGRCYQCSMQTTENGCEETGICKWIDGRDELGGSDCTLCAGRMEEDCKSTGYCFWNIEGFEGVCSKCPGYNDAESCTAGGCFWRKVRGVEKCVKCGGFVEKSNCEAAGCKWNPDNNVQCGGNTDIFLLPPPSETPDVSASLTTQTSVPVVLAATFWLLL